MLAKGKLSANSEINIHFNTYGFYSRNFFYNNLDVMIFSAVLIGLIPIAFLLNRFIKVKFLQTITKRYYATIFHELLILVYLKVAVTAIL
jgi:hypothetical protein